MLSQGLADGLPLLMRAYECDPGHAGVLVLMAHVLLLRGTHAAALALASQALEAAEGEAVRAEALALLARAHHAGGSWQEAASYYTQARARL